MPYSKTSFNDLGTEYFFQSLNGTITPNPVSIDQTTPGATNNVSIDGTVDGANKTNSVTSNVALLTWTAAELKGMAYVAVNFTSVGSGNTVIFEADSGSGTFQPVQVLRVSGSSPLTSASPSLTETYLIPAVGQRVQVRVSTYGSGTVTAYGTAKRVLTYGGPMAVIGNISAAVADSGGPVKVGGVYNATPPTLTTGQRGDMQLDSAGNLRVVGTASPGTSTSTTGFQVGGYDGTNYRNLSVTTGGALVTQATGNVANGSTDSGNPVKVGGKISAPTSGLTTGNRQDILMSTGGNIFVEEGGKLFSNITTATTTTVKSGAGIFDKIIVNTPVNSATITIYDSTTASGSKIATITLPASATPIVLPYQIAFGTGLTIVTSGATDITVAYR